MFKRSLCGILILNISISFNLYSQQEKSQKVIPASPVMRPYQRYGEYPVNHSTGLAQISIPLYEIKVKDFVFPIDISFHASGRCASYEFSPTGVGWVLNAFGTVSRER